MKYTFLSLIFAFFTLSVNAQGWPEQYDGVMLQGFYWDSYSDTRWTKLEKQAEELADYFDLIWIPQSGYCGDGNVMGYLPLYYFFQQSSFGSETELRSMINSFKDKGLGTIADVVINHRATIPDTWCEFPAESFKGNTYQMTSTDICQDDDGGAWMAWAQNNGYNISSNVDSGEGWSGARDLDHYSSNVTSSVKAYLDFLLNDLGYAGFRYDMVKGYKASFTADYNTTAKPQFSVGEYWDSSTKIKNWIDGTRVDGIPQSAAFDFQFRYRIRDAINKNDWKLLSASSESDAGKPLIYNNDYKRFAVTFVENHDTEKRASAPQDPIKGDTLAANAFILAMPGTPCVFLKHWINAKGDIKRMISARKLAGIHNQSTYQQLASEPLYYAVKTAGNKGNLICVVGKTPKSFTAPAGFTKIIERKDFIYYISDNVASQWDAIESKIQSEGAIEDDFTPHTATIYVRDELGWSKMNYYIWDSNNDAQLNGAWPGKQITDQKEVNGYTWYYQTFNINKPDYYVNVVFNTNSGNPQTVDLTNITDDIFYVIKTNMAGNKYLVEEDKETLGVHDITVDDTFDNRMYNIAGHRVISPQPNHIYIQNRKKYIFK